MRLRTNLRAIRGDRPLVDAAHVTMLHAGDLSRIERGHQVPNQMQTALMRKFYGHPEHWYPATVQHALRWDDGHCAHCGEELPPDAIASRRYHDDCRGKRRA